MGFSGSRPAPATGTQDPPGVCIPDLRLLERVTATKTRPVDTTNPIYRVRTSVSEEWVEKRSKGTFPSFEKEILTQVACFSVDIESHYYTAVTKPNSSADTHLKMIPAICVLTRHITVSWNLLAIFGSLKVKLCYYRHGAELYHFATLGTRPRWRCDYELHFSPPFLILLPSGTSGWRLSPQLLFSLVIYLTASRWTKPPLPLPAPQVAVGFSPLPRPKEKFSTTSDNVHGDPWPGTRATEPLTTLFQASSEYD